MADKEGRQRRRRKEVRRDDTEVRSAIHHPPSPPPKRVEMDSSEEDTNEAHSVPTSQSSRVAQVIFILSSVGLVAGMGFLFISLKGTAIQCSGREDCSLEMGTKSIENLKLPAWIQDTLEIIGAPGKESDLDDEHLHESQDDHEDDDHLENGQTTEDHTEDSRTADDHSVDDSTAEDIATGDSNAPDENVINKHVLDDNTEDAHILTGHVSVDDPDDDDDDDDDDDEDDDDDDEDDDVIENQSMDNHIVDDHIMVDHTYDERADSQSRVSYESSTPVTDFYDHFAAEEFEETNDINEQNNEIPDEEFTRTSPEGEEFDFWQF